MARIRSIMDRTEASDAFDAGSIPVGCTGYLFMNKKKKMHDSLSFKEVMGLLKTSLKDHLLFFKEWIADYGKIFLPLMLLILVSVTVVVSLNARERVEQAAEEALEVLEETKAEVMEVQETLFEEDAYPEINALIKSYYEALEHADIEILLEIQNVVTATEIIRLQKMSDYIDRYENIKVYTKPGPYLNTYIAYVYSDVYMKDREESTPGLQAFYICLNDYDEFYINAGELTEEEALYIKNVSQQGDVVDLKNAVSVSYSTIMAENEELSEYWAQISVEIDLAVGEQLALEAKQQAQLEEEANPSEPEEEYVPEEPAIIMVRAKEQVNIRKSASASADKVGSAHAGDTFVVIERMANGWTKVSYNSGEAYISTIYLEDVEDVSKYDTTAQVTVNTSSLNVRTEPDQSSSKLGVLVKGQVVDLIEATPDGWSKIKYNGQIGFVKSEFVD